LCAELIEEEWHWLGEKIRCYQRPLRDLTEPLSEANFLIEHIREPSPSEALKRQRNHRIDGTSIAHRKPARPMTEHLASQPALRPARPEDFDYCARLYFEAMGSLIKELNLDMDAHFAGFRPQWDVAQVRIITLDRTDIGWLQSFVKDGALFLGQLFVDSSLRGQGIGTELVKGLIEEAASAGRAVTLGVVKTNPALRLYERLGFRITHEDERKFYMRRD
jgi:ribosomal protein S18 acetylase RimI-like enzyme